MKATGGPVALALWPETFRRDSTRWMDTVLPLFQKPPRGGIPLASGRTIAVIQAWGTPEPDTGLLLKRVGPLAPGWVLMLDSIEQSWEPRAVAFPKER